MAFVSLIGTSGTMALKKRPLTSMLYRTEKVCILLDAGEGTQTYLGDGELPSVELIDAIFITHSHVDHWGGLLGIFHTMGEMNRSQSLILVYPKQMKHTMSSLISMCPTCFKIIEILLSEDVEEIRLSNVVVHAFRLDHSVVTYGYSIVTEAPGEFDKDKAESTKLEPLSLALLQENKIVQRAMFTYTGDSISKTPVKKIKVTYFTDTRPCKNAYDFAVDSDLLIAEGMYGNPEDASTAVNKMHMTMYEAADIARAGNVRELWLTHFSRKMITPKMYLPEVKEIFSNTVIPYTQFTKEIRFSKESPRGSIIINEDGTKNEC